DAATDFWSQALGCTIADRDAGDGDAEYQMLGDTPGDLHIEVQKVAHPSRVHLDIETDDVDAEADRLEALGAKKIAFVKRWWVMEAPTGQRFCIVRTKFPERGVAWNDWD
ncbi:MAG TPA: VOC family protein, partial [Thermomonas sp.]|nr:VOC family protein [Thermomonas sp.]HPW12457.1 VOC family protein [Thermomonas sp.]